MDMLLYRAAISHCLVGRFAVYDDIFYIFISLGYDTLNSIPERFRHYRLQ